METPTPRKRLVLAFVRPFQAVVNPLRSSRKTAIKDEYPGNKIQTLHKKDWSCPNNSNSSIKSVKVKRVYDNPHEDSDVSARDCSGTSGNAVSFRSSTTYPTFYKHQNTSVEDSSTFNNNMPDHYETVSNIPPLPKLTRYRSQENIFVSPACGTKLLSQKNSPPKRKLSISTLNLHPLIENAHKNTYPDQNKDQGGVQWCDSRKSEQEGSLSHSTGFPRNYLSNGLQNEFQARPRRLPDNDYNLNQQRRRASIVTIHMIPSPGFHNSTPTDNGRFQQPLSQERDNIFCSFPNKDIYNPCHEVAAKVPFGSAKNAGYNHTMYYPKNRVTSEQNSNHSDGLKSKYRSSVDLTCFSKQDTDLGKTSHFDPREREPKYQNRLLNVDGMKQVRHIPISNLAAPAEDRNIFKTFVVKIQSIASPSDDESSHSTARTGSDINASESEGIPRRKSNTSIVFVYKDFDDMIAKMLESKELANHYRHNAGGIDNRFRTSLNTLPDAQLYFTGQLSNNGTQVASTPNPQPHSEESKKRACNRLVKVILKHRIQKFNIRYPEYLLTLQANSETYEGSIRVTMNLLRPVEVEEKGEDQSSIKKTLHLPRNTVKVHRITSETATRAVITRILAEFKINENPRKFVLYHRFQPTEERTKTRMRRLDPEEYPLRMYLDWAEESDEWCLKHNFVLQENDTGDIEWELFSLPELHNFLRMLNKEEKQFLKEIKWAYKTLKRLMKMRIGQLETGDARVEKENKSDDDDDDDDIL